MARIRVLVASGAEARRAACRRVLQRERGVRLVGETRSGLECIAAAGRLQPHVLLLDVGLFRGVPLLQAIRGRSPRTRVILLTHRASQARILQALSYGARGSIDTRMLGRFLAKAVRVVAANEAWVARKMVARILDRLARVAARTSRRRAFRKKGPSRRLRRRLKRKR